MPRAGVAATDQSATPRVRPMGVLMAAILAATMLGLVYLTQTLGSNATSTEIGQLEDQRTKLDIDLDRQAVRSWSSTEADAITAAPRSRTSSSWATPSSCRLPDAPCSGRTDSRLRMVAIMLVFAVFATAAGLRLGYWQVVAADELTAEAIEAEQSTAEVAETVRADIVDRDGVVLAKTASLRPARAHPDIIDPEDQEAIVDTLDAHPRSRRSTSARHTSRCCASGATIRRPARPSSTLRGECRGRCRDGCGLLPGVTLERQGDAPLPAPGGRVRHLARQPRCSASCAADGRGW